MISLTKWRWLVATVGAIVLLGRNFTAANVLSAINWNVLLMIAHYGHGISFHILENACAVCGYDNKPRA